VNLSRTLELKNTRFGGRIQQREIPTYAAEADLVLGIFGATMKTQRVIPHKVYQGLAMKKPVLTGDTPAIREIFTPDVHLATCRIASPDALAGKIAELQQRPDHLEYLASNGYNLIKERYVPTKLGAQLKTSIEEILT
jgi:glycosyltransferase involved in cell wall biosynthesis